MPEQMSVVCAGYMPLDLIHHEGKLWRRAGGTSGNVAAILAFLGWDASLAGRVGDDLAGEELIHDLGRAGVECSLIDRDAGGQTNLLLHRITPKGHLYEYRCPSCGAKLPRSRPLTLERVERIIEGRPTPDVYFFDRVNSATVALAEHYAPRGCLVVYEPSTPANMAMLERALACATIVKGSVEHGPNLVGGLGGLAEQLQAITDGAAGARFRFGVEEKWSAVGTFKVPVTDASGAGDWTTAAMLHRLAGVKKPSKADVRRSIEFGHSLAALNCAVAGARGLMEGRSAASVLGMATRLRKGERRLPREASHGKVKRVAGRCEWCLQPAQEGQFGISAAPRWAEQG
jgi:sugar/nucleoside kinase (ribokinase family)